MLLPSILRILNHSQVQSKAVKSVESGFKEELSAAAEGSSGLDKIELAIANAADALKPLNLRDSGPDNPQAGQGLEELLRIITKFEESNQKRVVDVFE